MLMECKEIYIVSGDIVELICNKYTIYVTFCNDITYLKK
jgi:hypothetical protein